MNKLTKFVALALVISGFSRALPVVAETLITIDGSSTVYPITEAVAEEFQSSQNGKVKVTVGISGTGGGFKKFTRGELDVSDASRPISKEEIVAAKEKGIEFVELPIAFDALTVVVNPQNTWVKSITVEDLKKIWEPAAQGKIVKWNQVRAEWPDAPIKLFGPGSDSGTFDYFTEAIVGKAKASRGDYTASEDDNVLVQGVKSDKYALGYFGYSYYVENKNALKAVPVVAINATIKEGVLPSEETVLTGKYQPLSRPIFIYVNKNSLERSEVANFVDFYLKNAAQLVKEVKYIPLPSSAYDKGLERLAKKNIGTAFGGNAAVGLHVDEIFNKKLS